MPSHLRGWRLLRPGLAVALLLCVFARRSEAFLLLPSALCPPPATSEGCFPCAHLSRIARRKPLPTWIPTLLPCSRGRPSWFGADTVTLCQGEDHQMGVEVAPQERKPRRRRRSKRANKKSKKRSPSVMDCKSSSSAIEMLSNSTKALRLVDFNHALRVCARDRGNVDAAQRVFAIMDEANIAGDHFSYNTLLDCIAKSAQLRGEMAFKEGMSTIELMKKQGVEPDLYSFNALLNIAAKGASQRGDKEWVSRGLQVLQMMQSHGVMPDVVSYNVLIDACSRAAGVKGSRGRVEEGMNVLRQMTDAGIQPDIVSFNSLINVCAKAARVWGSVGVSQASRVLQMMEECNVQPDSTTFNCLLNAYAQAAGAGQVYSWDEMVGVLDLMKERGITPDVYTYNCVLNVCAKTSRVRRTATNAEWGWLKGLEVIEMMKKEGVLPDVVTYTALLDACLNSLRAAGDEDIVRHGKSVLDMMRAEGIQPNSVSYTSLINAAKLDGSPRAVELGYQVYLEMPPKARNVRTFTAVIGALSRVGRTDEAMQVFRQAENFVTPDTIMYSAIMGAVASDREAVLDLHAEMQMHGLQDDDVTTWQVKQATGDWQVKPLGGRSAQSSRRGGGAAVPQRIMPASSYQPKWRQNRQDPDDGAAPYGNLAN